MSRDWRHSCSADWLNARRSCLTASDIKRLITDHRKIGAGKLRLPESMAFARVFGEKLSDNVDTESRGDMARGHILEPYAVEQHNSTVPAKSRMHWWDDRIVVRGSLGFSPDALDVPQMSGTRIVCDGESLRDRDGSVATPTRLLEIKCYEGGSHWQRVAACQAGAPIDERWQVACAMAVCESLSLGTVMFYAPQCRDVYEMIYTRDDLRDEIATVLAISEEWDEYSDAMMFEPERLLKTEDEIYSEYLLTEMTG